MGFLFARLRAETCGLAEFESAIGVGPTFGPPWYRSQKEHMIGWIADYEGPGAYLRSPQLNPSARSVYARLNCAPSLVWIFGALEVPGVLWRQSVNDIAQEGRIGRMSRACGALRRAVPWSEVECRLLNQKPISPEEWRESCKNQLEARSRLREKAYNAAAHFSAQQHEEQDWTPVNIDKIISSLPEKTPSEREVMRKNANKWLTEGSVVQKGAASQLIEALDDLEEQERATLNAKLIATPIAQRVRAAFAKLPATETEVALVRVLLANPRSTSAELTSQMGWDGQSAWHMHFGTMCKRREADLWPANPAAARDGNFYSGILANFDEDGNVFEAKLELVDVLRDIAG